MISLVTGHPLLSYLQASLLGLVDSNSPQGAHLPAAASWRDRLCSARMASIRPIAPVWPCPGSQRAATRFPGTPPLYHRRPSPPILQVPIMHAAGQWS